MNINLDTISKYLNPKYSLYLLMYFPIFGLKGVSILIILFILSSVVFLLRDIKLRWNPDFKIFLISSTPFVLYVLGLFYTDDFKAAFKVIEISLPLLLISLVLFVVLGRNFFEKEVEIDKLYRNYIIATSILTVAILIHLFISGSYKGFFDTEMLIRASQNRGRDIVRTAIETAPIIGEHPTYFGLMGVLSFVLSANLLAKKKFVYGIPLILSVVATVVSGSKISIISLVISALLTAFLLVKKRRNRWIVIFSIFGLLMGAFTFLPSVQKRFSQILETKFEPPKGVVYNSTNVRIAVYQCDREVFLQSPFIGHGTGGHIENMREFYKKFDTDIFARRNYFYNSHNQYISFALSNGFIGALIFIAYIVFMFVQFAKSSRQLIILCAFCMVFMTENILERQTGVILFALFTNLMLMSNLRNGKA